MGERYYDYVGLRVESELEIPEWAGFEWPHPFSEVDVTIRLADGAWGRDAPAQGELVVRADECSFRISDIATYRVRKGCTIDVSPVSGAGWQEVRLFLLGSAWGALCYQRGLLAVHASAVRVGDGAVAFCSPEGGGKSTLVAWLITKGHGFVSDDLTRLDMPPQGRVLIHPSAQRLKLWRDALDALAWSSSELERDHYRHQKFHLPVNGNGKGQPVALRALYVLNWGESCLERLSGHTAVQQVISAATYRGQLLQRMDRLGLYWQQCIDLVRRVPVWELTRPRDLSTMEQTLERLEKHWAENEQENVCRNP